MDIQQQKAVEIFPSKRQEAMKILEVDGIPVPLPPAAPASMAGKAVLKHPLQFADEVKLRIYEGSEILTVQSQRDQPFVWALADTDKPLVDKWLCIRGTGHPFKGNEGKYLGTMLLENDSLVLHVFEAIHAPDKGEQ